MKSPLALSIALAACCMVSPVLARGGGHGGGGHGGGGHGGGHGGACGGGHGGGSHGHGGHAVYGAPRDINLYRKHEPGKLVPSSIRGWRFGA